MRIEQKDIEQRLREIIAREKSANALADKSGVSLTLIRKYLDGAWPRLDKLAQIAEAAEVSLFWLVTGQEENHGLDENTQLHQRDAYINFIQMAWEDARVRGWLEPELSKLVRNLKETFPDFRG